MTDFVENLCLRCGLCCNGTVFGDVAVAPEEIESLTARGFTVTLAETGPSFAQPCPCFHQHRCAAYHERPAACRAFDCQVLKDLAAGAIDEPEATRRVDQALTAVARLAAVLPAGTSPASARDRSNRHTSGNEPQTPQEHLLTAALYMLIERHFLPPKHRLIKFRPAPPQP